MLNPRTGNKERIGRLLEMHANDRQDLDAVYAGDIVAGIGLKNTRTGDTLCDPGSPIVLEELEFPEPVIHVAVEPKTKADQDKMSKALAALVRRGSDLPGTHRRGDRTNRHLRYGRAPPRGAHRPHAPRVPGGRDRRQATGRVPRDHQPKVEKVTYTHKKQTGGAGQYAEVTIHLENTGPGGGYEFVDAISGGRIPKEYIPSVDAGIQQAMTSGVLAGYPTVDVRATLVDGKYHDVDSSEMAFKIAGTMVFRDAAKKAKPVLLEPIMRVEVVTPEDYMGDVIGDLSARRGKVGGMEQRGNSQVVRATVPLSDMFGYATDLRSRTQGRATYTMHFDSYQQMPASVQEEIVASAPTSRTPQLSVLDRPRPMTSRDTREVQEFSDGT